MNDNDEETGRLDAAARWYSALQDPDVTLETWDAFRAWERDPDNAAAYREIEASLALVDRGLRAGRGMASPQPSPGASRPPRRRLAWMAGIAALIALCALAIALTAQSGDAGSETYITAVGEQRTVTLADGSQVTLNTDTALDVAYTSRARHVSLVRGQALFEVAKSGTPFIVAAGNSETRALGTRFDIYLRPGDVAVTLLEGSVVVSEPQSGAEGRVLAPGDRLAVSGEGRQVLSRVDPGTVLQWRSGMVQFDNATLAEAAAELNRYSTTKIQVPDPGLAAERLSGTFPADKPEEFASNLALFLPVSIERSGQYLTLVPASSPQP
mgnify:CR=1 FL=1|tara:strand:- start:459 stop:1436 length:978 start_codon:yes stop_codon:yes gene_type:complete